MKISLKDRHVYGAGAAACAICCTAPLLTVLGVAGAAATAAAFAFAGMVFGIVVAAGAGIAVWRQRRQDPRRACGIQDAASDVPVGVQLTEAVGGSRGASPIRLLNSTRQPSVQEEHHDEHHDRRPLGTGRRLPTDP